MNDFIIEEPYRNTKQNLVKERHYYANRLSGGLYNLEKATITIEFKKEKEIVEVDNAALWLDKVFQHLISGKPKSKIEKRILKTFARKYLTLDEIKELIKIKVARESDNFNLTEC